MRRVSQLAALGLGAVVGVGTETAAALLLYTTRGFLGTAGFLVALALAALALGLWVGAETVSPRRRWIGVIVAYALAAVFALLWSTQPVLRQMAWGGALAAFFLIAEPAYTAGAAYQNIARGASGAGVSAFFGAAGGVIVASLFLIPQLRPSVIFVMAAVVLLAVALLETRPTSQTMNANVLSLHGKTAVVTGTGDPGQLGFAVAQRLNELGARICITARSAQIATLARTLGDTAVGVSADLTSEDDVARLLATVQQQFGRLDILVNVAGGLSVNKPLADTTRQEWQRELQRNAETAFVMSRAALPLLRAARGSIINFASPAGERAVAQLGAYSAAKAAVVAFTRALAIEEKPHGVRVNALAPGMIDTEQNRAAVANAAETKWVTRTQVADAVAFLASDAAAGITGETIQVLGETIT